MPRIPAESYFNDMEVEQRELFDRYQENSRHITAYTEKGGKHASPYVNKYSPLYNFATLVGDAEVPKYFYDNSTTTEFKKTQDQLAAIKDQIDRDYEGARYDAPAALLNKLQLLEAKEEWLKNKHLIPE